MLYTKDSAKDNVRNRQGERVLYLGKEDRLTDEARDYLKANHIRILDAAQARPDRYRLLSGGFVTQKPEHMTHLNAQILVPKTHPRIRFRGAVDTMQAQIILCQQALPQWSKQLQELLELSNRLISCDVLEEPLGEFTLDGLTEQEQRRRSHLPQEYFGQPHFMPKASDGEAVARLNLLRCLVRQTELAAVEAFTDRDGAPTRVDLLQALNRMSSQVYILMIRQKAGKP